MAATKRKRITQDDIFRARYVVDGDLHQDGQRAVYVVSETAGKGDKEKQVTSLWLADISTVTPAFSNPTQLVPADAALPPNQLLARIRTARSSARSPGRDRRSLVR